MLLLLHLYFVVISMLYLCCYIYVISIQLIPFSMYIKFYLFVFSCAGSSPLLRLLSLSRYTGFSLRWIYSGGIQVVYRLLIAVASLRRIGSRMHGFQYSGSWALAGSVVVAHGSRYSLACGIFLDQESNPCLLRWQEDSFFFFFRGLKQQTFIILQF